MNSPEKSARKGNFRRRVATSPSLIISVAAPGSLTDDLPPDLDFSSRNKTLAEAASAAVAAGVRASALPELIF